MAWRKIELLSILVFPIALAGERLFAEAVFSCGDLPPESRQLHDLACAGSPSTGLHQDGGVMPRGVPISGCDDGSVIDIMVVYTAAARIGAGGVAAIESQIATAMSDTNLAFSNSLINTSVNLVHTEEVAYTETGNSSIDGPRLVDPDDGFLDEVHPMRDLYAADIVALWVEALETGGRVVVPLEPTGAHGFHELRRDNWAVFTTAHELGHNLGCAHDRPNAFPDEYFSYSFGFHQPAGPWHTIMAVAPPDTSFIPYFSNPNVTFGGLPTGVAIGQPLEADCAATINQTRHIVANYRNAPMAGLPAVLFVDGSAAVRGDGLSWATAFNDLQHALCQAARSGGAVQEIWVAAGTYTPDLGTGLRQMTCVLRDGLALHGGFDGTETMRDQREPVANITRISGDIGTLSDDSDNSIHVVTAWNVGPSAVLDGFVISDGKADTVNHFFVDTGGGVRNEAAGPTLSNCVFESNSATNGAGMGNYVGSDPDIANCTFVDNTATSVGGGMHNDNSSPDVSGSTFSGNFAEFGGAIAHFQSAAEYDGCTFDDNNSATNSGGAVDNELSDTSFTLCQFIENSADFGGAMRNLNSSPTLNLCTFDGNTAGTAGAMANQGASAPMLTACDFLNNAADWSGAMDSFACSPTLVGCSFVLNSAVNGGGAMTNGGGALAALDGCTFDTNSAGFGGAIYCLTGSDVPISGCEFTGNTANDGGAMYVFSAAPRIDNTTFDQNAAGTEAFGVGGAIFIVVGSTPLISRCTFTGNMSGFSGGAVRNDDSPSTFVNCGFFGNTTDWSGGGMENNASDVVLTGCVFSGNRAESGHGGGVSNLADSNPTMTNLTLTGNHAGNAGGGIAVDATAPVLTNSILWGNSDGFGTTETQQIHHFGGATIANYCTIQGWSGGLGGTANNAADPMLVDPDGGDNTIGTLDDDVRLSASSPAIDFGDNTAVPMDSADLDGDADTAERSPFDIDGNPRFADDAAVADMGVGDPPGYPNIVDRGAYEFPAPTCGSCLGDMDDGNGVDGLDIGQFVACFLNGPAIVSGCECADMDASTTIDSADVGLFVSVLLASTTCP